MVSGPVLLPTDLTIINSTDWNPKDYLIHPPNIQVPLNLITFPTASALPHWSPSTLHLRWHTDDHTVMVTMVMEAMVLVVTVMRVMKMVVTVMTSDGDYDDGGDGDG